MPLDEQLPNDSAGSGERQPAWRTVDRGRSRWLELQSRFQSEGLAIWFFSGKKTIYLRHQDNFPVDQLQRELRDWQRHGQLLLDVARDGEPRVVAPGWESGEAANPTPYQLLIAAERVEGNQFTIVELLRDATVSDEANGFSELVEAAHLAASQERITQLRQLRAERKQLRRRDQFAIGVHRSLDPQRVAYHIANNGRRLIGCDRVVVALPRRGEMRIVAVSGQTELNGRSNHLKLLELLIRRVAESGQAVVFGSSVSDWPEPVRDPLIAYTTSSASRAMITVPLKWPDSERSVGAVVFENFETDVVTERFVEDAEFVAGHATVALRNSDEHAGVFLHSVRRRIGQVMTGARWPRRFLLLLLLVTVVVALCVIPIELRIEGTGTMRPEQRRGVFAPESGTVVELLVDNGDRVTAGQPLAALENPEISIWQDHLAQELANAEKSQRIREAERSDPSISPQRRIQLDGEVAQYEEQIASYRRQLQLIDDRIEELTLKSPINGVIATWDTNRQLLNRTVAQGDLLLLVNDESESWRIEIHVREADCGDVLAAWRDRAASRQRVPVDYILATHPERRYRGWLKNVENRAETIETEQVVHLTLVPDHDDLPPLRDGTEVRAKIRCGSRPVGYVWLRDVIRFVQARVLF